MGSIQDRVAWEGWRVKPSGKQFAYRIGVLQNRQGAVEAVAQQGLRVDAETGVNGGQEILGADRPIVDFAAVTAGSADDLTAANAPAGKHGRESTRPVRAAWTARPTIGKDPRRTAKLAHGQNQNSFVQTALPQVVDQRAEELVEDRQQGILHRGKVPHVRIPGELIARQGRVTVQVDGHKAHTRFNEPTCDQRPLAPQVSTIALAERLWLARQVEGHAHGISQQQVSK